MKKRFGFLLGIGLVVIGYFYFRPSISAREEYEAFLRMHPYKELMHATENEGGREKGDRPDLARMQDYLRTMDPAAKRPTPEKLLGLSETTARFRDSRDVTNSPFQTFSTTIASGTQWVERGPQNVGGRTRALMFDPNDATKKKVWAGGVSGGLWFNSDITNVNSVWQKVNDFWDNLAITCIAFDPVNPQVFYVGTGEGWFNLDLVIGAGIWKTTNGGTTWTRLPSTTGYTFVNDIVVRNEGGVGIAYTAVQGGFSYNGFSASNNGLYRSADGGTSWNQVMPASINDYLPTDIEIGNDNKLYVGAKPKTGSQAAIYVSTDGLSWPTRVDFPFNGRVEIACSPSDASTAYAIIEDDNAVGTIVKTSNGGSNWSSVSKPVDADTDIPSNDFSRGQAFYDLILVVHPTDPNNVIVGAVDLFKTTNGGTGWSQITKWWSGIAVNAPVVHADQHAIAYRPGFPNEAIFGNDGGVYYGTGLNNAASAMTIAARNSGYNVTQFYTGAIHPTLPDFMLAGSQDNGTQKFTQAGLGSTSEAFGGDGAMCFIDQKDPAIQIVSYVFNDVTLSTNGGSTFTIKLLDDGATGNFINNGEYDSNLKILFTARNESTIYRVKNVTTTRNVDQISISMGAVASVMRLSPFATTQSNLYVGTEAGRLFKLVNAQNATPTISEITANLPAGAISGIAFGASENQMVVTFSNYGVVSVWETTNGGGSWTNKEGNLPNMPVRSVEYHPVNFSQVYLATELGVWSTEDLSVASPVWNSTNGGLANVRTDMLRVRKSDNVIMAATHGRGVFTALIPTELDQTITFNALTAKTFGDAAFSLTATSTSGLAVTYSSSNTAVATISGSTVTVIGAGTTNITANQAGNVQYKVAPAVVQVLTVNKSPQTITFGAITQKSINDAPFALSATASSSLPVVYASSNTGVASVSGSNVTITGVGTSTITASQSGNTNYLAATSVTQTLTVVSRIIKLTGTLSFGDVIVGESKVLTFLIENTGTAPLNVTGITYPTGYTGTSVTNASNITVTVTLTPTNVIDYNGEIVVASDATSGNNKINTTGKGVKITSDMTFDEEIKVYPNPAREYVEIKSRWLKGVASLQIIDATGKKQSESVESVGEETVRVQIGHFANGVYIIAIPNGQEMKYQRFVKQ
jgi:photosystem II stability/assembly factor-like uncharacterized protein